MSNIQIIIPMSGRSTRFRNVGFETGKALIRINGKAMLEYVISMFDKNSLFIFIVDETDADFEMISNLIKVSVSNFKIVPIGSNKLGPSMAIYKARNHIDMNKPTLITYIDYFASFDLRYVEKRLLEGSNIILAYSGFHPHMQRSSNYAFVSTSNINRNLVTDIREKESFTDDPSSEFASAGLYGFTSGKELMIGIEYQLLKGLRTNNEFYVSLAYKGLITESNKNTEIAIARRFCQWGTPEDLEDWIYWNSNINYFNSNRVLIDQQYKDNKESAIILNLGLGTRISTVTTTSKWNIPVFSSRLIDFSIAIASSCNESLLITSDKVSTKSKKTQVYLYKGKTRGQAETASIGFTQIRNKDNPIHILSNDNIISQNEYWEIYRDLEPYDWEILVGVIKNYPAAQLAQNHYSWVHTNEANQIENISIKSKTEGMTRSIIGNFVFRNNRVFQNAMSFLPNNIAKHRDVHLDYIISDCLDEGMKAYAMEFRHFLSIGTSYEYRTLEYWNSLGILPEGSENE